MASRERSVGGVRQDEVVVSGSPHSVRGYDEPQPFTHLSVPNADLYRAVTDKELEGKFREAAEQPTTSTTAKETINVCWQLESYPDIRACLSLLSNVNATEPNRPPDLTG